MTVAYNPSTGEGMMLEKDNSWQKAQVAKNKDGAVKIYDGQNWVDAPNKQPEEKSQSLADKLKGRFNSAVESVAAQKERGQSPIMTGVDILGKTMAGGAQDVIGSGISSVTPGFVKKGAEGLAKIALNTPVGKAGLAAAQKGMDAYKDWSLKNPDAARHLEAITNIAAMFPVGKLAQLSKEGAVPLAEKGLAKMGGEIPAIKPEIIKQETAKTAIDAPRKELLSRGFRPRTHDQLETTANTMRGEATSVLGQAKNLGSIMRQDSMQSLTRDVDSALSKTGLNNQKLHGDTLSAIEDLKRDAAKGNMTLEQLEQHRQLLRQVIKKNTTRAEGPGVEVPKAMAAIDAIDNALDKMDVKDFTVGNGYGHAKTVTDPKAIQLLKDYRDKYARARRFERLSDIITSTHGDASKTKDALQKMINKKGGLNGFTPQEKIAIRKLASRPLRDKALQGVGTLGLNPAKKNFNAFVPAMEAMGSLAHPAIGIPMIGGTAANLYRNMLTRGQAEKLLDLVQKGGPRATGQ